MSFNLMSLTSAEALSSIEKILPDNWLQHLLLDLEQTATALNMQINFQSFMQSSGIAPLALALVFNMLQNCENEASKETIKVFVCTNIDKSAEYLLVELSNHDSRYNLITFLIEFKKNVFNIEYFDVVANLSNPVVMNKLSLKYEPIAAINFMQQKIKEKLLLLGYQNLNPQGYVSSVVETWLVFLRQLFNDSLLAYESVFVFHNGNVVDILWPQISVLLMNYLKNTRQLECSDKVYESLRNTFLGIACESCLQLSDLAHNPFSIFAYHNLLKPVQPQQAFKLLAAYFSSIHELLRPQMLFMMIAYQTYQNEPLKFEDIQVLRQQLNISFEFINYLMFNQASHIETQNVVLDMVSLMTVSEKKTFFEKLNSNQQNYLQFINQYFPTLFDKALAEFSYLAGEDKQYILLQLDDNQENLLLSSLKNDNFRLLSTELLQQFDLDFVCYLLMQAELNSQNIFSLVSDGCFEFLVNFVSKLPAHFQSALISQRINQVNILNWIIANNPNRLNNLLALCLEIESDVFDAFFKEGEVGESASIIALNQSPVCLVNLLGFIKTNYPHLMFRVFFQNGGVLGLGLLKTALLQKSEATDYLIAEINALPEEERQLIYTKSIGKHAPALFFALLSNFKYRSILAACLKLPTHEMRECLIAFPFNFDELLNETSSWMLPSMTKAYFESLLDLDVEDFMLTLFANKLIFNKSQNNTEILKLVLNHGMKLCSISGTSPSIIINFNKFLTQILSNGEVNVHLLGLVKLFVNYLNKSSGQLLADNLSPVLLNLCFILIQAQHQALFIELSLSLSSKNPKIIQDLLQVINPEYLLKAHLESGFLFLPSSFSCENYQIILERIKALNPDDRFKFLTQKQVDQTHFLLFIIYNHHELFPQALSLLVDLTSEQQMDLWLNEDEIGNLFILNVAQNTPQFLHLLYPLINDEQVKLIFSIVNINSLSILQQAQQLDNGSLELLIKFLGYYSKKTVAEILCTYPPQLQQYVQQTLDSTHSSHSFFSQGMDLSSAIKPNQLSGI